MHLWTFWNWVSLRTVLSHFNANHLNEKGFRPLLLNECLPSIRNNRISPQVKKLSSFFSPFVWWCVEVLFNRLGCYFFLKLKSQAVNHLLFIRHCCQLFGCCPQFATSPSPRMAPGWFRFAITMMRKIITMVTTVMMMLMVRMTMTTVIVQSAFIQCLHSECLHTLPWESGARPLGARFYHDAFANAGQQMCHHHHCPTHH